MFDSEQPENEDRSLDAEQLEIVLDDRIAEGLYANLVAITHSKEEFVLDFIRVMPGREEGQVMSRLILTPGHTDRFLDTLARHVRHFEENHGRLGEPPTGEGGEKGFPPIITIPEAEA